MGKSLLYARSYPVNDKISIRIPTVGEILEDEARYNSIVSCVISTPYDFMVYLDDMGIDFEELTEYDLFLLLFPSLQATDTGILFGDLDLSKFSPAINEENGTSCSSQFGRQHCYMVAGSTTGSVKRFVRSTT